MASSGRIIVSNSKKAIGVHLSQWQTQPTASLTVEEAQELVRKLEKAIADVKGETVTAPPAETVKKVPPKITLPKARPPVEDDDDDIA